MDHAASLPKRKRKRKLPRSGYKFLPRSRRPFGTNSTLVLREGGPWLPCPHGCLQAQDARHLDRYGPEGHYAATQRPLPLLALYALGNLDFLRATGIWQLLVRCSSCLRSAVIDFSGRSLLDLFPYSALFDSGHMCLSVYGGVASWCSGPDALHHGRYGPAGAVCGAVHKTAEIPQLQFIVVVVILVITQRQIPMVLVTKRFPCCWTQ